MAKAKNHKKGYTNCTFMALDTSIICNGLLKFIFYQEIGGRPKGR